MMKVDGGSPEGQLGQAGLATSIRPGGGHREADGKPWSAVAPALALEGPPGMSARMREAWGVAGSRRDGIGEGHPKSRQRGGSDRRLFSPDFSTCCYIGGHPLTGMRITAKAGNARRIKNRSIMAWFYWSSATESNTAVVEEKVLPEQTKKPIRLRSSKRMGCVMRGAPQFWPSAEANTWISLPVWTSLRRIGRVTLQSSFFWLSS